MPAVSRRIIDQQQLSITLDRLCFELIENHNDFANSALIGIQPRGIYLARRIKEKLQHFIPGIQLPYGELDISFFRDDFRRRDIIVPSTTNVDFLVEGKRVILIDDVFFTGRTIRAAMDALLAFGRPATVELLVLIHRKYSAQLPIAPDYTGVAIDTISSQKVKVHLQQPDGEDGVWLISDTAT
jgi:pyrimidine operon attenuation protein/uracil phosphoribosyltransferase